MSAAAADLPLRVTMVVFLCSVIAGFLIFSSRRPYGSLFNPLSIFVAIWALLLATYSLRLLPYYDLLPSTWVLLISSTAMFVFGSAAAAVLFLRRHSLSSHPAPGQLNLTALRRLAVFLAVVGLSIFLAFLVELQAKYTLTQVLMEPWRLRRAIGQREVSWFLRYFYFTMPAAVLALVYQNAAKKRSTLMQLIIAVSLICGIATTGRTAVIWLLAWLACLYLYFPRPRVTFTRKTKMLLVLATSLVVAFAFFTAAGLWMGKTYKNSGLAKSTTLDGLLSVTVIPYYYFTASIPAFQNLTLEPDKRLLGQYTFMPILKAVAPVLGLERPTEVAPFTATPFPSNTYTYLLPYYMDFGVAGVLVCPFLLGFISSYLYLRMKYVRVTLGLLYINSLIATALIFSFGTNRLISSPTWWFILIGVIAGQYCRRGSARACASDSTSSAAVGSPRVQRLQETVGAGPHVAWLSRNAVAGRRRFSSRCAAGMAAVTSLDEPCEFWV